VTGGAADLIWFAPTKEILSSLKLIELEYPPGKYSHYSNLGFQVLGVGLQRAAKQPFTNYIESHIIKPLGMKNTGFMLDEPNRSKIAVGHVCSGP
jgi:CubicO group peptidase (beta-lactamase class C family)